MPAKIAFAGENACRIGIRARSPDRQTDTYKANTFAKRRRKGIQNVDGWVKPSFQPLIDAPSLIKLVDLALKHGQKGGGRIACFQLGEEVMSLEILLGHVLVCLQGLIKDDFKIGRGGCRWGNLRHRAGGWRLTHVERTTAT